MSFSKDEVEYYHDLGLMPDWAYYQQNGKSLNENYRNILMNSQRIRILLRQQEKELAEYRKRREKEIEEELEEQLEDKLGETIDKVLNDLLKDFQ